MVHVDTSISSICGPLLLVPPLPLPPLLVLQGAPFGFTPFCDNNKDMEGFRFWKQGFWKEHLRGKPYHISALFVVDLARFRSSSIHAGSH